MTSTPPQLQVLSLQPIAEQAFLITLFTLLVSPHLLYLPIHVKGSQFPKTSLLIHVLQLLCHTVQPVLDIDAWVLI